MNTNIRPYQPSDKDGLLSLMEEFNKYLVDIDNLKRLSYSDSWTILSTELILKNNTDKSGIMFVAENNGSIIGFIQGLHEEQSAESIASVGKRKVGRITEIFVTKNYRSQNIGSQLMEKVEQYFKENGYESIFLDVWAINKHARDFYSNKGYVEREIELVKIL